ncbi:PhnD/SsuA/transferrin family substrate-binding protein [Methanolobus bombayensis]|uniref:PhnD/SsuA/transferrin family substrate-binding protein n=1 Tax=Methanolobus bombayensis TaxID=38023 RepID=UPI001AE1A20F|nr:PhnD/SsuA/transferrin family substrate-binding protein [Methanolobus bombayensis]MBP1909140.1 phosphonate transport system substrate-binding protein [Methanolobus bombayensis]
MKYNKLHCYRKYVFVISLILCSLFITVPSGCFESEEAVKVSLENTEVLEQSITSDKPVRIGVFAMASPKTTMVYYEDFLDYLSRHTGLEFELVQRDNPDEINYLLETGYLDFVFLRGEDYMSGHDDFDLEMVAVPVIHGDLYLPSYVISRSDSDIDSIEDFRGKKFAFNSYRFNRGDIVPDYMHPFINESPEFFFSSYIYSNSQDNFIDMVNQGTLDGAEIDCTMWSYIVQNSPEYSSNLKIVYSSSGHLVPVIAVHPEMSPNMRNEVVDLLFNMHDSQEGVEVLENMHFNMFVEMDHETYSSYAGSQ